MLRASASVTEDADAAGAVREGIPSVLVDAAAAGFAKSQELVPKDQATLMASGVPPQQLDDGSVVYGYNADHAEPVEEGSAPHWAPIDPLKGWARRVLGDESAAWAVQATIAEEGTPAQPYMRPSVDVVRAHLRGRDLKASVRDNL